MKTHKNFLIWLCFIASNVLAFTGLWLASHNNKVPGRILLVVSFLFLIGFWLTTGYEIYKSSRLNKLEKASWPLIIIILSLFGQIWYMMKRKSF